MRAPIAEASTAGKSAPAKQVVPNWKHELELHARGYKLIAGVDEAAA